jgi:hypothetical protein
MAFARRKSGSGITRVVFTPTTNHIYGPVANSPHPRRETYQGGVQPGRLPFCIPLRRLATRIPLAGISWHVPRHWARHGLLSPKSPRKIHSMRCIAIGKN